jgi:hypothetical protein
MAKLKMLKGQQQTATRKIDRSFKRPRGQAGRGSPSFVIVFEAGRRACIKNVKEVPIGELDETMTDDRPAVVALMSSKAIY